MVANYIKSTGIFLVYNDIIHLAFQVCFDLFYAWKNTEVSFRLGSDCL